MHGIRYFNENLATSKRVLSGYTYTWSTSPQVSGPTYVCRRFASCLAKGKTLASPTVFLPILSAVAVLLIMSAAYLHEKKLLLVIATSYHWPRTHSDKLGKQC